MGGFRRVIALLLLAGLLPCLAACGGKRAAAHTIAWQQAPAYTSEDIALPAETERLTGCCTSGDHMYILGGEEDLPLLCRVPLAGGGVEVLESYQGADIPEGAAVAVLGPAAAPDGALWVYTSWTVMHYDLPEDFDEEWEAKGKYFTGQDSFYQLLQLDPATGKTVKALDFSGAVRALGKRQGYDPAGFAVDGEGRIYLSDNAGISVLDSRGEVLFTLEAALPDTGIPGSALALLGDGTVAALTVQPGGKREVRTINPAAKGWGKARYALPDGVSQIYSGSGGFLFLYVADDALCAWEPGAGEGRELLRLANARLESSPMCAAVLEEGRLLALTLENGDSAKLRLLSPTDQIPEAEKIRLTYGTIGLDGDVRAKINRFNQENETYYIDILDYASGSTGRLSAEEQDAAESRLYADAAAGKGPDIWSRSLPLERYARQGIFEDLWPWIEGDPELGREGVMEHVLECTAPDGKLYTIGGSFTITTAIACADVVGHRTGWTLDELLEAYRNQGPGAEITDCTMDSELMLRLFIRMDLDRYVDWETGQCQFDTEYFKSILALCAQMRREADFSSNDGGAALRTGQQLLWQADLLDPSFILYFEALCAGAEDLVDYEAYLNENHIYATLVDDEGNWREKEAISCPVLSSLEYYRAHGGLSGSAQDETLRFTADAVFGALEGGGYVSYVGLPTQDGAGSYFTIYDMAAMSASCQNKEGAWAFLRQTLLPGGSMRQDSVWGAYSPGFPINRADFEEVMSPKWFRDKNGELMLDADGQPIEEPQGLVEVGAPINKVVFQLAPNQAQRDRFMELYNAITHVYSDTGGLYPIIREQAEAYFAGDKSLDETAALIQSRASIYVNEQR